MPEKQRLLNLIDRAWRAEAWHGPALLEVLDGVTPAMAAKRVVKGRTPSGSWWTMSRPGTRWWRCGSRARARRCHPSGTSPHAATHARCVEGVARPACAQPGEVQESGRGVPRGEAGPARAGTTSTWYVLIHGEVQHQLYHAGQMALLKRGLGKGS
jgi:hypothetical protein